MKLLVLGASSQLGRELTAFLLAQGIEHTVLNSDEIDLLKQMDVVKVVSNINPTQVINVASYSNLEKAEADPDAARQCDIVNTEGVSTLAEVCDHLNLPLIHHSSSFVFDGLKPHPYSEEDKTDPGCRYGLSKWYGERAIRNAIPQHVILRTDWLFSVHRTRFFEMNIDACKVNQGKIDVMDIRFSPTPAADVARVIVAICRQVDCGAEAWGTFHYASLQPVNQDQFVEQFLREASQYDKELEECIESLKMNLVDVKPPYIRNSSLNCEKIKECYGIKQRSRAEGINKVLAQMYQLAEADIELSKSQVDSAIPAKKGAKKK